MALENDRPFKYLDLQLEFQILKDFLLHKYKVRFDKPLLYVHISI